MTEPPEVPPAEGQDPPSAEYIDPFEGMDFTPYDPSEATQIPQGTPLGDGDDTPNETGPFDPRYKEDFEGLAFLGALEARFSYIGHRFHIRTLTVNEILAVAQVMKEHVGTVGEMRAHATAMVALSVVSVDGIGLPAPFEEGGSEYAWAQQRFDYVKAKWFPFTVDYVYERYLLLEARVNQVLAEMAEQIKKSGSQDSTPG